MTGCATPSVKNGLVKVSVPVTVVGPLPPAGSPFEVGSAVGSPVGSAVGSGVGSAVGSGVGSAVGSDVGSPVGPRDARTSSSGHNEARHHRGLP